MSGAASLVIAPILLPLLAGAGMLLLNGERHRAIVAGLNVTGTVALVCIAVILLGMSGAGTREVYRLGNWPAPFGIVLVLDRLSALMLLLTNVLALATAVFSLARWHRAGAHFHSLFQFLLMGLNGAFLTGDLFNLFVFFELLLAASYGLLLHGSGIARVKAGLHYIVVNLAASLLFLIGVSLIYGVTGTLNMADLAARVPAIAAESRGLLEAGAGVLAVAFLLKAGMWPLSFWLPTAYAAASPPVASIFAIMTKVGVYVLLRLSLLLFGEGAGASAGFGSDWLLWAAWRRPCSERSARWHRRIPHASAAFRCSYPPERCSLPRGWDRSASPVQRSFTWSARRSASAPSSFSSSSSNAAANLERT